MSVRPLSRERRRVPRGPRAGALPKTSSVMDMLTPHGQATHLLGSPSSAWLFGEDRSGSQSTAMAATRRQPWAPTSPATRAANDDARASSVLPPTAVTAAGASYATARSPSRPASAGAAGQSLNGTRGAPRNTFVQRLAEEEVSTGQVDTTAEEYEGNSGASWDRLGMAMGTDSFAPPTGELFPRTAAAAAVRKQRPTAAAHAALAALHSDDEEASEDESSAPLRGGGGTNTRAGHDHDEMGAWDTSADVLQTPPSAATAAFRQRRPSGIRQLDSSPWREPQRVQSLPKEHQLLLAGMAVVGVLLLWVLFQLWLRQGEFEDDL